MRNSIRTRLIIFFILVAVLPLLIVGLILGWRTFVVQRQQALNVQEQVVQRVSTEVVAFFDELESQLRIVVEVRGLRDLSSEEQRGLLSEFLTYQDAFDELALLDSTGREELRLSRLQTIGPDDLGTRSQDDAFRLPMDTGEVYFSPVRFDEASAEPLLTIAVPIFDPRSGQVDGVLVADARLKRIWDLIANVRVGEDENVFIVDEDGRVIAHRNPSVVLRETTFAVPDQDGVYPGLDATNAVLAYDQIVVGGQSFYIVAERSLAQALNLAITTIFLITGLTVVAIGSAVGVGILLVRQIVQPVESLAATAQSIAAGELSQHVEVKQRDEIGRLAEAFNTMTARLRDFVSTLEERVAVRTADLEQRSAQLQAAADVGRAATSILDVDELVRRVVDLIRGRFDLYYVGLFLVDDTRKWAVLQAGTGEAGDQMLARGHRLEVGEASMIGWSVSHAQARIAQLAEEDAVRLATPELPETRAEAALPLRSRGEVLGAFTVQSDRRDAFDEATIAVLQTMADQVAVALDNARLFAEAQAVLEAERRAYGDVSREAWQELLQRRSKWGYRYANQVIVPLETPSQPEMAKSTRRNESEQREKNGSEMHMPLKVRDQTVGVLRFQKEGEDKTWTAEEKKLLGVLTEELGQALESARLYEDTQRRAARERLTSHITARMRETLDMETVVQTALREIGENLGIAEIKLRMADREEF